MLWIGTKTKSKTLEIVKSLRILDPRNNFYKSQKVDLLFKVRFHRVFDKNEANAIFKAFQTLKQLNVKQYLKMV